MPPSSLQTSTDYRPALLWLMNELGSGRAAEVIAEFDRRLGHLIPPAHRETNKSGFIKWEHYVRWSRQHLYDVGMMRSAGKGIWMITEAGREWLINHPDGGKKELIALRENARQKIASPNVQSFQWRGQTWQVEVEQLSKQAKEMLAHEAPSEATRFRDWAVYLDNQPVSAKWLFHLITGAAYQEFDSPTARRLLAVIGLESEQVEAQTTPTNQFSSTPGTRSDQRDAFLQQLLDYLQPQLKGVVSHGQLNHAPGTNYLQVSYAEFPSSHYELRLARGFDEIAFHLEGNKAKNLACLTYLQPYVEQFSQAVGQKVVAEPWGTRWARLVIKLDSAPWNSIQAKAYAGLMTSFIGETFPYLRQAFGAISPPSRRRSTTYSGDNKEAHALLDQEINHIHEYLNGRSNRPSDELLCEWVHFCYKFQLFREGVQLFELIDPSAVEAWPYDRAKRLAKVCRIRSDMT